MLSCSTRGLASLIWEKGECMLRSKIPKYLILSLSMLWILACSSTDSQIREGGTDSSHISDCRSNYRREGGLISSPIYKTWMKYDQFDLKKGFDLALKTLQSQGDRIVSINRVSGTIVAEMILGGEKKRTYPATVKFVEEKASLFIHLRLEGTWGRSVPPDLCSFYDEFGRLMKRASPAQKTQSIAPSLPKPPEQEITSPPPPVPSPPQPVAALPPPPPSVSTASPIPPVSPTSLSRGTVIWVEVNLRDGPSLNSKIIGKVFKGSPLEVYEEKNGWLRVRLENERDGWMSKRAVSENPKIPPSPGGPTRPANSLKPQTPSRLPGPM